MNLNVLNKYLNQEHTVVFDSLDWIRISIANYYGKDKLTWEDRLLWFYFNEPELDNLIGTADEPLLFARAVRNYRAVLAGKPVKYIMSLDATSSFAQVYAVLTGCKKTAKVSNLLPKNKRYDLYSMVAKKMSKISGLNITRSDIKKPVMTTGYNSMNQPKEIFDSNELKYFYKTLDKVIPGVIEGMEFINEAWDDNAYYHSWTLPDKHVAKPLVKTTVSKRIELDEYKHTKVTYQTTVNEPSKDKWRSLAPNVIHSLDGFIARIMVRLAKQQGFTLAHIHDSFWFQPMFANQVIHNYKAILAWISEQDLLGQILSEISGEDIQIEKDHNLSKYIMRSYYALS